MENSQSDRQKQSAQRRSNTILQLLTDRGVLPDRKISSKKRQTARQKKQRDTFHNTLQLLQYYRKIAWLVECFPDTIAEELEQPFETVDELLDGMEVSETFGERKLKNRISCVERTRLMLDRVNEALTVLKKKPEDGELLFELMYLTFITPESLTITQILYRLNISARQYYRLRHQAIDLIALRLWGSPDSTIDLWLELLSYVESSS